jgi:electron transfer flavoprotein alpha subunit
VALVLHCDDADCAHGLAEPLAALMLGLAPGYSHLLAAATAWGRNVMPRLAALLDVQIIAEVARVVDAATFVRPIYANCALATVRSADASKVLTVRPNSFEPVAATGGAAPVEGVAAPTAPGLSHWLSHARPDSARPDLGTARVVVAGGRGLGSPEAALLLEDLADHLGGAVGASLAAIEAGFLPGELQVGQSGRSVAPDLYVAVGISGAIQHLAGMQDSKVVVAINLDPDAAIFSAADYGMVGDLLELVPALSRALAASDAA